MKSLLPATNTMAQPVFGRVILWSLMGWVFEGIYQTESVHTLQKWRPSVRCPHGLDQGSSHNLRFVSLALLSGFLFLPLVNNLPFSVLCLLVSTISFSITWTACCSVSQPELSISLRRHTVFTNTQRLILSRFQRLCHKPLVSSTLHWKRQSEKSDQLIFTRPFK